MSRENEDRSQRVSAEDALRYHGGATPGKIEVVSTKPLSSQYDLALAYSPGVAEPCRRIEQNPDDAYKYTAKGNLVAVITNGTAVLGLGNIGPAAAKPVMEGKGVLFKKFAGIDVFDLELSSESPEAFVETVSQLEAGLGGINLEDIRAPECFYVEEALKERCSIPVMHDDQHGTAIITGAALLNALDLAGKELDQVQIVFLGAGAAAIACARFYCSLGVKPDNLVMMDEHGVIHASSVDPEHPSADFATKRDIGTFEQAIEGADVLVGLSVGNIVTAEHLESMARDPIVFALANPDPEIDYQTAKAARPDVILTTGRSDYPNQVNNVLGFPFIFRGALDVGAREINEPMKVAATTALAQLAREPVPETVNRAYSTDTMSFGREYLIPKPLDPRLVTSIAPAVAKAAMDSGAARYDITDWEQYETDLLGRVGVGQKLVTGIISHAREAPKRVIFAEADDYAVLRAAEVARTQGIAEPILLGRIDRINTLIENHAIDGLSDALRIDPRAEEEQCRDYATELYERRQRKGVTYDDAVRFMQDRNYFGAAMVARGEADAMLSGRTKEYPKIIRPALEIIGTEPGVSRVAGMYIVNTRAGVYFCADTTVNLEPSADELVDIIGLTARTVRFFNIEPTVAVLSHSNFGSTRSEEAARCQSAVAAAKERFPDLVIDGEIQANVALNSYLLRRTYPFSDLVNRTVNTLIFPNLSAGNISYKLLAEIGGAELIGPVLMGMRKPVHVLQLGSSVREIVNMVALAVVEAQDSRG
jgi:malate dehydrogenase (oxaloacetate-decarboxylating)(NADP+)